MLFVILPPKLHMGWDTYVRDVQPVFSKRGVTLLADTPLFQDTLQRRPWAASEEIPNVTLYLRHCFCCAALSVADCRHGVVYLSPCGFADFSAASAHLTARLQWRM